MLLVEAYLDIICKSLNYIFEPVEMLVRGYSETAGEGISQIFTVVRNTVAILPIIILSISAGVIFTNSGIPGISELVRIEIQLFLAVIFGLSSVFASIVMYIGLDNSLKDTVFASGILLLASIGIATLTSPKVYAFLIIIAYGMGSYIIDRIIFENPYPADYLSNELETTEGILRNGVGLSVPVIVGIVGMTEYNPYISDNIFLGILLISTVLSYSIPKSQRKYYENLYEHRQLNTSSQLWILSSKVGVIISFSFALIDNSISLLTAVGLLSPLIVSILFSSYIHVQKKQTTMGLTYKDAKKLANPLYISANKDIRLRKSITDDTADIDMYMSISIPEDLPRKSIAWQEFLKSTHNIHNLLSDMAKSDNVGDIRDRRDEFEEFYEDVAYQYYLQNLRENKRISINRWSDGLVKKIMSQMYRCDDTDLQDIYDLDIRNEMEEDDNIYINVEN